jgi:hypothetical protein
MKPRDVTIKTVLNGWLVQIGCQTAVFTNRLTMLSAIGDYLQDPGKAERDFFEDAVNAKFFNATQLLEVVTDAEQLVREV